MEERNCTACGKALHEGDWVSKSGLCRACAEAKYDEKHPRRKKAIIIIASVILSLLFITILYNALAHAGEKEPDPLESFMFAGYSEKSETGVFIAISENELVLDTDEKENIIKALRVKYIDEYPDMESVTVMLGLPDAEEPYCCFADDNGEVIDLEPALGLLILGAVSEPTETQAATDNPTLGEKNALDKACDYLDYSAFSYKGLIEQLEYEGFSHEEAVYGASNCGADWNEQAVLKAQQYLEYSSFSRSSLIDQLEYEGFTTKQAEYGAKQVGY